MTRRLERAGLQAPQPARGHHQLRDARARPAHARLRQCEAHRAPSTCAWRSPARSSKLLTEQWAEYIPNLLLITDESGPVALGGVMGGFESMVTDATTEVFFESAYFAPEAIQGRAKALQLTSDAAYRFERGVDFAGTRAALERATELTLAICGGQAGPVTRGARHAAGAQGRPRAPRARARAAGLRRGRRLHGARPSDASLPGAARWRCAPRDAARAGASTSRIEEDFVEEVARVHGYEHVPAASPRSSLPMLAAREGARSRFDLKRAAAGAGLPGSHQLQLRLVALGDGFRRQRDRACAWPIPSRARWT